MKFGKYDLNLVLISLSWILNKLIVGILRCNIFKNPVFFRKFRNNHLSGHFSQKQAKTEVVKIKKSEFSYWA